MNFPENYTDEQCKNLEQFHSDATLLITLVYSALCEQGMTNQAKYVKNILEPLRGLIVQSNSDVLDPADVADYAAGQLVHAVLNLRKEMLEEENKVS